MDPCRGSGTLEERIVLDATGQPVVESRFRVRYCETDAMGIVHHTAYITWFEEGRSAFTRCIGYPYAEMEVAGILLAVAEVQARYHHAARYDEEIVVATWLQELLSRGMVFRYEIRSQREGNRLVSGITRHVILDRDGRVQRFPVESRERLLALVEAARIQLTPIEASR